MNKISKDQIIIGINPGASYGSAKCWLKERFQEVAEKLLLNQKITILFFGDPSVKELVTEICQKISRIRIQITLLFLQL
jgi:heptosyltransferase-2